MFRTKSVITLLLIALGLSLFYLWYSTWHKNISTHSINKHLIEESLKPHNPNNTLLKPLTSPTSKTQTPNVIKNNTPKENPVKTKEEKPIKPIKPIKTIIKPVKQKPIPKRIRKRIRKIITYKQKPRIVKKPILIKKPIKNQNLHIKLNQNYTQKPIKMIKRNNYYQAGAFKYFSDALSLSIELKAKGYKTKIIHQNGLYKVIAY